MDDVPLVIRNAKDRPQRSRDTSERGRNTGYHLTALLAGTRDGRCLSNISKILRYSSVHDDGLTNP
ncbi:MAG: hypothetical protein H0U13_11500 [Gemmatimonadaceae bacterium]|nr:hypothetical protein [Gemmatimonadaceae bacterium]